MRFEVEIFDRVQQLAEATGFNDHQLHGVLRFDGGSRPDPTILHKAVIATIAAIPILGARYVDGARPYWQRLDPAEFERAFLIARAPAEFEAFLVSRPEEPRGPQLRVCLLDADPAAVAITLNHMVCDAAGFKSTLYFLCDVYTKLSIDPAHIPRTIDGDRGIRSVVVCFSLAARAKSLLLQRRDNNRTGDRRFPLDEGGAVAPFIATRRLTRETTLAAKTYAQARAATLNDMVLAAYYRSLFRVLQVRPGDRLLVPMMVDMRRYLDSRGEFTSLTNMTSMVATELDYQPDEPFPETLRRVKQRVDSAKHSEIGLNAFLKLDLLFSVFSDQIAAGRLRARLENPLLCTTNIGMLDETRLSFAGQRPCDAFVCGSIKYKPYFQLAVSTYRDEITLSVNLYGGAGDRQRVDAFLHDVEAQFPE